MGSCGAGAGGATLRAEAGRDARFLRRRGCSGKSGASSPKPGNSPVRRGATLFLRPVAPRPVLRAAALPDRLDRSVLPEAAGETRVLPGIPPGNSAAGGSGAAETGASSSKAHNKVSALMIAPSLYHVWACIGTGASGAIGPGNGPVLPMLERPYPGYPPGMTNTRAGGLAVSRMIFLSALLSAAPASRAVRAGELHLDASSAAYENLPDCGGKMRVWQDGALLNGREDTILLHFQGLPDKCSRVTVTPGNRSRASDGFDKALIARLLDPEYPTAIFIPKSSLGADTNSFKLVFDSESSPASDTVEFDARF